MKKSIMQNFCAAVLQEYVKQARYRQWIKDTIAANFDFIPVNCRYRIRRGELYYDICELLKLTASAHNYALLSEILYEMGARATCSRHCRYFKGLVSKKIQLDPDQLAPVRSKSNHVKDTTNG